MIELFVGGLIEKTRYAIEVDGVERVPLNTSSVWTALVDLDVGVNRFDIVARDHCQAGTPTQISIERTP